MLRKSTAVLAVVSCLVNTNTARAEPGSVVDWLMNEPASLFDVGMLRLQRATKRWINESVSEGPGFGEPYLAGAYFSAIYDWDENRIYVSGFIQEEFADTTRQKSACKATIRYMSAKAGIDSTTGRAFVPLDSTLLSGHFNHFYYDTASQPKDYRSRLDQVFVLRAFVGPQTKPTLNCRRDLLSNKVYFEE